jgi:phosphatidylglycerophosphatase A
MSVVKESSDELNPATVTQDAQITRAHGARSAKDYLALAIATCGVGYLPLAPGTWGSLVGFGLYILVRGALMTLLFDIAPRFRLNLFHLFYAVIAFEMLVAIALTLIGVWAASRTEKMSGKKDPSKVVIDEVAGQFIALLTVPFMIDDAWWSLILAFILFRFFDIVKPYPARTLESLKSGLGIMADDVVAGVYAAIGVAVVVSVRWLLLGGIT